MKNIDVNVRNEEAEASSVKEKASNLPLIISVVLFAIVLSVTVYFYVENINVTKDIEKANQEIALYDQKIAELRSNRDIIGLELIEANKREIESTIVKSEAQKYITELIEISKKYKIQFSGFSYNNGKIATAAVSVANPGENDAVENFRLLIADLRNGTGSTYFKLEPVSMISGQEQKRNVSMGFTIAPTEALLNAANVTTATSTGTALK